MTQATGATEPGSAPPNGPPSRWRMWRRAALGALGGGALGLLFWWFYREDGVLVVIFLVIPLTLFGFRIGLVIDGVLEAGRDSSA